MPPTPRTRLGAYEICGALGAGGMGEVYLAEDTTLGRTVAIKTLGEAFAADSERVGSATSSPPEMARMTPGAAHEEIRQLMR